jgi:hypothetical protein
MWYAYICSNKLVTGHNFVSMSLGILVAKKKLFKNPVPTGCGGGTVFFVCISVV